MSNPGGNYPGRQMFVGRLKVGMPAFAYFVSGRSDESKSIYATDYIEAENSLRIKPIDKHAKHDPLRHYQAIKIDPDTGIVIISNSQAPVDGLLEVHKLGPKYKVNTLARTEKILGALGPEYDSKDNPTPRIVGMLLPQNDKKFGTMLGITTKPDEVYVNDVSTLYTFMFGLQTYNGDVDYKSFDPIVLRKGKLSWEPEANTAEELANELYCMSNYIDLTYGELRVCTIAGVHTGKGPGGWEIATKNKHNVE